MRQITATRTRNTIAGLLKMNIDFEQLKNAVDKRAKNSTLLEAELLGAVIPALEVMDHTGQRESRAFKRLYQIIEDELSAWGLL